MDLMETKQHCQMKKSSDESFIKNHGIANTRVTTPYEKNKK